MPWKALLSNASCRGLQRVVVLLLAVQLFQQVLVVELLVALCAFVQLLQQPADLVELLAVVRPVGRPLALAASSNSPSACLSASAFVSELHHPSGIWSGWNAFQPFACSKAFSYCFNALPWSVHTPSQSWPPSPAVIVQDLFPPLRGGFLVGRGAGLQRLLQFFELPHRRLFVGGRDLVLLQQPLQLADRLL